MKAIKKCSYYYDPPSWRVCPECGGSATVETKKKSGIGSMLNGAVYTMVEKCPKCANSPRPGYLPIYYTSEQWQAARRWIPVEEELPSSLETVWCFRDYGNEQFAGFVDRDGEWYHDIGTSEEVTHWQPLPEPPEEEL